MGLGEQNTGFIFYIASIILMASGHVYSFISFISEMNRANWVRAQDVPDGLGLIIEVSLSRMKRNQHLRLGVVSEMCALVQVWNLRVYLKLRKIYRGEEKMDIPW